MDSSWSLIEKSLFTEAFIKATEEYNATTKISCFYKTSSYSINDN